MRRFGLALAALALGAGAVLSGPRALADEPFVPDYPHGLRAPMTHGVWRYYLNPGTMIPGDIVHVTVDGVEARERGDGTWLHVGATPPLFRHTLLVYLVNDQGTRWGAWIKFRKVTP